eukprot:5933086-Prymnesium_polylepis.1
MGGRYGCEWVDGRSHRAEMGLLGGSVMRRRGSTWVDVGRRVGRTGSAQGPQAEMSRHRVEVGR